MFDFDRFGNMYRKASSNPTTGQENPLPYTQIEESDISKSTNRLATGTTYDEAGQVVNDAKFRSMGFGYDANGRMIKATKPNTPDAATVYDALGNRVATKINDVWTFVIYDAFGKLVAEYGGLAGTDDGGVRYVMQDWQGSPRAVVSNTGNVQSRSDFTAFGEEIQSGIGLRTSAQGYGVSNQSRQGYGLTEKDDSSGLNHTWFRKNENRAGRWTSADPYKGSMSPGDPQSFNRYSYVGNEPTNFIDPSGLLTCTVYIEGVAWFSGPWSELWPLNRGDSSFARVDCGNGGGGGGFVPDSRGGGGGTPTFANASYESNAQTEEDRFEQCLKEKMKKLRAKLNRLMNQNLRKWAVSTATGGLVNPITGLVGSLATLMQWSDEFNNFKTDEYDPALAKAKEECKAAASPRPRSSGTVFV